jgi:hypothetical protein
MTKRTIKKGFEFSLDGENVYKTTTDLANWGEFLAIWIGDYSNRDMTTYNGFIRHGDFRLDQALFKLNAGKIEKVEGPHGAFGVLAGHASKDYKSAVGIE